MQQQMEAVVFDFNGTLVWDTPLHNQSWDILLKKYDIQLTDDEKMERMHGKTNQLIIRDLFGEVDAARMQQFVLEKEGIYQHLCVESGLGFAPGVKQFWDDLRRLGIRFAIATSSGPENVEFYFKHFQLNRWFDEDRVIFNNGAIASKPNPEIFDVAIRRLAVNPSSTVIFEDSRMGIQAAMAAQAGKVIIVNSTNDDYSDLACEVITHFDQVDRSIFKSGAPVI